MSTIASVISSSPIPKTRKCPKPPACVHHPAEVLTEEPGQERERHEDRGDDRELLHDGVEAVRDGREVDVHRAGEQVAVGVDHVADPDQVVVDVAEVALVVVGHAGEVLDPGHDRREEVALRRDHLPHAHEGALHREDLLQLRVVGVEEDRVLEHVDPVVDRGQAGEEAVDEAVDDLVEQPRGIVDRRVALDVPLAERRQRGRVVAVQRDQVAVGVEAVHLDEAVGVGRRRRHRRRRGRRSRRSRRSSAAGRTATSPRATADGSGTPRAGSRGRPSSARGCRARRSPPPSSNALTLSRSRWSPCSTLQWTTLAGPDGSDSIGRWYDPARRAETRVR